MTVMKKVRTVYEHGFGMADLDHDVKITPVTVFHVGSISDFYGSLADLVDGVSPVVPISQPSQSGH